MNMKKILLPLVAILFLAGCNSGSGSKKTSDPTSEKPAGPSYQPVPTFDSLPEYPEHSGSGIAENHFQGFSISPNNVTYGNVGESFVVKTSNIKPNLSIPAEELVFSYETNKSGIVTVTPSSDTRQATVECLVAGDVTLTVYSYQKRYNRVLKIRVLPNDGSVDFYQPEVDSSGSVKAAEKAKFGWVSGSVPGGVASGDAELGTYTWHFEREQVGATITGGSGTFKFGTGTGPEGKMTFSTTFTRQIKEVVIQCSSAGAKDPDTSYSLDYGTSTFNAWFGTDDYLERTVDGVTYAPGVECHTSKNTTEESVQYHIINCLGKTGAFSFEIGASTGAIYLKSILIEYAEQILCIYKYRLTNKMDFVIKTKSFLL